uniref:Uncharacterized protein n=1 Tax=Ralstonia solanacearum TaxID=305 RepID=A0A0S4W3Z5_RALSL|nr:protein of unknown function [Ralstonia solanacearum]CUV34035.1 protein of unknown function [Ralstonia solanacearum]CUV41508.1 protein of unknown function [Ralstonia solanacearum]CUV44723.1 protein of unknown function [Ralstonia solanacearum]CUV59771.1 protein of unknown function [Ralstonia solanacearum]
MAADASGVAAPAADRDGVWASGAGAAAAVSGVARWHSRRRALFFADLMSPGMRTTLGQAICPSHGWGANCVSHLKFPAPLP